MSRKSKTHFDVEIEGAQKQLTEATSGAFEAVRAAAATAGDDREKLGVVLCQLELTANGTFRLRGAFIEPEWTTKIAKLLIERAEKLSQERRGG